MTTVNVIGDVAGRYQTLLQLLAKLPPAELTILAGDLVDRGPANLAVLELVRAGVNPAGGRLACVLGNHEFMMMEGLGAAEHCMEHVIWTRNGGESTLRELQAKSAEYISALFEWLRAQPVYFRADGLLVTHAPAQQFGTGNWVPPDADERSRVGFTWPRAEPRKPIHCAINGERLFNAYGHNGRHRFHLDDSKQPYGVCLDASHSGRLMGLHWPTLKTFEVEGND